MNQMKAPLHEFAVRLIQNGEVQYFLNGLLDMGHPVAQDLEKVKAKRGREMNDDPEYPRISPEWHGRDGGEKWGYGK